MDDEVDDQTDWDLPGVMLARPPRRHAPGRWMTVVPVLVSLALHGSLLAMVVSVVWLSSPPKYSVEAGGGGFAGVMADAAVVAVGEVDDHLPERAASAAEPKNDFPQEDRGLSVDVTVSPGREAAELLGQAEESPPIGISANAMIDLTVELPHKYPAGWGRATDSGDPADRQGERANPNAGGPEAISAGSVARPVGDGGGGRGHPGAAGAMPVGSSGNKAPRYPAEARRRRYEGTVFLWVEIDERGRIDAVSVDRTSGYGILDEAAIEAVKQWRFTPARDEGHAVRGRVRVPIEFVMRG